MNKYEEALITINNKLNNGCTEEDNQAYMLLQELVDRATPKKPIEDLKSPIRYVKTYECPNCHNKFTGSVSIFCYHCGQKINWEEQVSGKNN